MKIVFLTEGSGRIGFGHIGRCISLAEAFREKGLAVSFIVHGDETAKRLLASWKNEVFNWHRGRTRLFRGLGESAVAVIDSYLAGKDLLDAIGRCVPLSVFIDDNKRVSYPPGIVVNGNLYAPSIGYRRERGVTYLLGSRYALLRKAFWDVPERPSRETVKRVLITFGGDDIRGMIARLLPAISRAFPGIRKDVVIGGKGRSVNVIRNRCGRKTCLHVQITAHGMRRLMTTADIAVSAGGTTLYELARTGVPSVVVGVAENQRNNIEAWKRERFIECAGWWDTPNIEKRVVESVHGLLDKGKRVRMAARGRSRVDGNGARAVRDRIIDKYLNAVRLRNARREDLLPIYRISNDREVRRNSFQPDKITAAGHRRWFEARMADPNCVFLVASVRGEVAGQVRFDMRDGAAIVSVSLGKDYRRLGLGRRIMVKALSKLNRSNPDIRIVHALIKEENAASRQFFRSVGFVPAGTRVVNGSPAKDYVYRYGGAP